MWGMRSALQINEPQHPTTLRELFIFLFFIIWFLINARSKHTMVAAAGALGVRVRVHPSTWTAEQWKLVPCVYAREWAHDYRKHPTAPKFTYNNYLSRPQRDKIGAIPLICIHYAWCECVFIISEHFYFFSPRHRFTYISNNKNPSSYACMVHDPGIANQKLWCKFSSLLYIPFLVAAAFSYQIFYLTI
jgi:hypothetical protein